MPRKARIDAPGVLHHIICRGIERRKIFNDDADRENFLGRLGIILKETSTPCYGWALIPNHFHLLLRTGKVPIPLSCAGNYSNNRILADIYDTIYPNE